VTILQEIHTWSKNLLAWHQDAITRLYANRTLTPADLDDLYALAKAEAGIPDAEGRIPKTLQGAEVAPTLTPERLVQLLGIREVANVNALAQGGRLPIAPSGLTVIYGENGAGKTGYSRVFKHACRARDQREPILPDAKLDPKAAGIAQAVFETLIDGNLVDLAWNYASEPPEPLSDISIFDAHCARAYIDNHGDFAYVPYGLDILEGLVGVCGKLKEKATQERAANAPSDAAYSALVREKTAVAGVLNDIPAKTKPEDIEALATLSEAEQERLTLLARTLTEADPKQKAQALRQRALRLNGLKERIAAAVALVSNDGIIELRTLIDRSNKAKKAAELAAAEFKQTPGQLAGTGGEERKALFEAAREFAKISHAEHEFPGLPESSACPLCQNPLGANGSQRLLRFEAFVQQTTEKIAKETRDAAATAYKAIQQARLELLIDDALREELTEIDPVLAVTCTKMQTELKARQKGTMHAAGGKLGWEEVPKLPEDPRPALSASVTALHEGAKALEATADERAKAAMVAEHRELDARRRLDDVKAAVLQAMGKHDYCHKLQKCMDGMDSRGISRKSTDLSRTMASQELADALNEELRRLKVHDLKVVMKSESPGGRTQFKLTLQLPGGGTPAAILSEGEQRAIAIASFLAEVKLSKGRGGVVFDDPVSSLDHRRRWEVAERLAQESLARQVIVFTHDIYFLCVLEQKAKEAGARLAKTYIRRTPAGFGVPSEDLPFDVLGTKDRIGRLRRTLEHAQRAHKAGDDDGHRKLTAEAYGELRLAWERCIEEVLLNEAIQRFGEGVMTQRLKQVVVTDDDYREIDTGMTKSSKFEHDAAVRIGRLPVPDPAELSKDIEKLDAWRNAIIQRRKQVATTRH
jgi:hypothetical protein